MRTFIAIKVNPDAALSETMAVLKKGMANEHIKWIDERSLHLTLKFLGETSEEQVQQVKKILADVAGGYSEFSFVLMGIGFFKSNRIPRVLFANISHDNSLKQLASAIENHLYEVGFEKEGRPFNPHLTLARIKRLKDKSNFVQAIDKFRDISLQPVHVTEIIFYQSILKPAGPVYIELGKYPLCWHD